MKYLIPIVALLAVVGALVAVKANQIGTLQAAGAAAKQAGPPPETISSGQVARQRWDSKLRAIGSVAARKGVTIGNDAAGIVTRIHFDSGDQVKEGAVLLELDRAVERAQLESAQARLSLAESTLKRTRALTQEGIASQAELDTAEATLKATTAEVSTLQAQIARKVVRAPFTGKVGLRMVNEGQYLPPGSAISTLQSETDEYVDFSLAQQHLEQVRVGLDVHLVAREAGIDISGVIAAIDPTVDPATRAFSVRAATKNAKDRLLPGMFVNVTVELGEPRDVVAVPVTAVVHATYGDSVFLIEDNPDAASQKLARQQFVQLGEVRGDWVEVTKGLNGGESIVWAGAFKLRNGTPIRVDNSVALDPKLNPRPPNR